MNTNFSLPTERITSGAKNALGMGTHLLEALHLHHQERRRMKLGWGLILLGAAATLPLLRLMMIKKAVQEALPAPQPKRPRRSARSSHDAITRAAAAAKPSV